MENSHRQEKRLLAYSSVLLLSPLRHCGKLHGGDGAMGTLPEVLDASKHSCLPPSCTCLLMLPTSSVCTVSWGNKVFRFTSQSEDGSLR